MISLKFTFLACLLITRSLARYPLPGPTFVEHPTPTPVIQWSTDRNCDQLPAIIDAIQEAILMAKRASFRLKSWVDDPKSDDEDIARAFKLIFQTDPTDPRGKVNLKRYDRVFSVLNAIGTAAANIHAESNTHFYCDNDDRWEKSPDRRFLDNAPPRHYIPNSYISAESKEWRDKLPENKIKIKGDVVHKFITIGRPACRKDEDRGYAVNEDPYTWAKTYNINNYLLERGHPWASTITLCTPVPNATITTITKDPEQNWAKYSLSYMAFEDGPWSDSDSDSDSESGFDLGPDSDPEPNVEQIFGKQQLATYPSMMVLTQLTQVQYFKTYYEIEPLDPTSSWLITRNGLRTSF
ncbi:hypothetical protein EJ05DRAFT_512428 [Pseudovirgaria hyperparasitica]|uniref:Uncharacterized protein n=1 Tax=Pseudovirgaria hyperparasitica TaxID=470096 RepID=A0A6A6VYU5_9PEZI|nr:uncharacterized protein EJ05DRAFT_512428 [Pseudovirgaria hyperparasitica]KAF2755838.1 hypothetical protein EJ05DRAFT_512428 [Pseudovirgaria hyperparasitica]